MILGLPKTSLCVLIAVCSSRVYCYSISFQGEVGVGKGKFWTTPTTLINFPVKLHSENEIFR